MPLSNSDRAPLFLHKIANVFVFEEFLIKNIFRKAQSSIYSPFLQFFGICESYAFVFFFCSGHIHIWCGYVFVAWTLGSLRAGVKFSSSALFLITKLQTWMFCGRNAFENVYLLPSFKQLQYIQRWELL